MIITIKKGYRVHVPMTRREMRKRGFTFRTFAHDPQKFSVFLTEKGKAMYQNEVEALMAIRIAYIADGKEGGQHADGKKGGRNTESKKGGQHGKNK